MVSPSRLQVVILEVFMQALLYGLYVLVVLISVWLLVHREKAGHANQQLLIFSIVTLILTTADAVCYFLTLFWTTDALYLYGKPVKDESTLDLFAKEADINDLFATITSALENATVLLADILLMWRAVIISGGKTWVLITGMVLLVGEGVTGGGQVVVGAIISNTRHDISATTTSIPARVQALNSLQLSFSNSFYVLVFVTNITMTTIIASMLWRAHQMARRHPHNKHSERYLSLMFLIIESGAAYALFSVLSGIFSVLDSTGIPAVILSRLSWGLSGIVPASITILVALGKTWEQTHGSQNTGMASTMQFASRPVPTDTESQAEIRDIELVVREVPVEHGGKPAAGVEAHANQP